jgi:hypothetical protein
MLRRSIVVLLVFAVILRIVVVFSGASAAILFVLLWQGATRLFHNLLWKLPFFALHRDFQTLNLCAGRVPLLR